MKRRRKRRPAFPWIGELRAAIRSVRRIKRAEKNCAAYDAARAGLSYHEDMIFHSYLMARILADIPMRALRESAAKARDLATRGRAQEAAH